LGGNDVAIETVREGVRLEVPNRPYGGRVDALIGHDAVDEEVAVLAFSDGATLVAATNHTFIGTDGKVVGVPQLEVGDELRAANGSAVRVTAISPARFTGRLGNVIVSQRQEAAAAHVVVTEGIQSGDWLLQSTYAKLNAEIDLRRGRVDLDLLPYTAASGL
jgi:hypothetical protein